VIIVNIKSIREESDAVLIIV